MEYRCQTQEGAMSVCPFVILLCVSCHFNCAAVQSNWHETRTIQHHSTWRNAEWTNQHDLLLRLTSEFRECDRCSTKIRKKNTENIHCPINLYVFNNAKALRSVFSRFSYLFVLMRCSRETK